MGFGVTSSAPCLAGVFGVCSFLFVTIWVAPENRARELRTRGSTVLTQDSQESQMGRMLTPSTEDQISCLSRLSSFPITPASKVKFIGFDFRVFGGNSGGPVYFRFSMRYYQGSTHLGNITQSIIGLVTEQVSDTATGTPISLARIVPAQFISETINMLGEYTGK